MLRKLSAHRAALAEAEHRLDHAPSYAEWLLAAAAHDELTGADQWRSEDDSQFYDARRLATDIRELHQRRQDEDGLGLASLLHTTIYRHQVDITAPALYDQALAGTKHIIGRWLDEVERSLRWLSVHPVPGLAREEKARRFSEAARVYGRAALLLSGGATWGFFHLGVVKALFEAGVLPDILSGASTGAMIAGGVCCRNDEELRAMYADLSAIRLDGLVRAPAADVLRRRAVLEPARLKEVLEHNIGPWTFAGAYQRSGRVLNISVSPTRTRQKPRLLSYVTTPDVLVSQAALASSALPGLFPPVELLARDHAGEVVPYAPGELWSDGSIFGDLPKLRLARLHNVNFFIVSQTNPHVAPVLGFTGRRGLGAAVISGAASTARAQSALATDLARRAAPDWGPLRGVAEQAYALSSQDYHGDIDIHPRLRPGLLTRVVTNPSRTDLDTFVQEGERATWPSLGKVADQTRLGRVLRDCVERLGARGAVV